MNSLKLLIVLFAGMFLIVGCGGGGSTKNQSPIANAGEDRAITLGSSVIFDGSLSSDSDGKISSYLWKIGDVTIGNNISFSKNDFTVGDYVIELIVTDDKGKISTDTLSVTVLDTPIITQKYINEMLNSNQTKINKRILADDNETIVNVSFGIIENNITQDVILSVNKFKYEADVLWANVVALSSSVDLKNVEISFEDSVVTKLNRDEANKKIDYGNIHLISSVMESTPVYITSKSNFLELLDGIELSYSNNQYRFLTSLKQKVKNLYIETYVNDKKEKKYLIPDNDMLITTPLSKINSKYKVTFWASTHYTNMPRLDLVSFFMTTDFITPNSKAILAQKKLISTRANKTDILNNYLDSQESKVPSSWETTATHRITDFDELLKVTNIIPTQWKESKYGNAPLGNDKRVPLLLVHGWQGDNNMKDPTNLLLWNNSEYNYWHNFLAYYLKSEILQKKYHVYLYHYTSYKHISYNAKILKELLQEVDTDSDLAKGLSGDGIVIMAHSMGGIVSRALIEEYEGLGKNAQKLKKLITLDTPHHGSVGSMDSIITNNIKDLKTYGAMDLNYDNFDNKYNATQLKYRFNKRRENLLLNNFDKYYCEEKLEYSSRESCILETANPYLKYLNKTFADADNKNIYNKKYIFYTAWNVHNQEKWENVISYLPIYGTLLRLLQESSLDLNKNNNKDLNFISNGDMDFSTIFIGNEGYAAGGAASIGSSILSSSSFINFQPVAGEYPITIGENSRDIFLENICVKYEEVEESTGVGSTTDKGIKKIVCTDRKDISLPLITISNGLDHPYGTPYRLFWDYDHESIFNGVSTGRGSWDKYIKRYITDDTSKDTKFQSHRADYIRAALYIRNGYTSENISDNYLEKSTNPLSYEPVFLVLEKDLLDILSNGDIDGDGMPDEWEISNGLNINLPNDATEDLDDDGFTNLQEYQNGTNPKVKDVESFELKANAGDDKIVQTRGIVSLDASKSIGINLTYSWRKQLPSGLYSAELFDDALWIFKPLDGETIFQLTVTDDKGNTATDTVIVTTGAEYIAPVAKAGDDQIIYDGQSVTLDGSASLGTNISYYQWSEEDAGIYCQVDSSCTIDMLSVGEHEINLTVIDEHYAQSVDTVKVTVNVINYGTSTKVIKTGQTISYSNFDDGYYEIGEERRYTRENDIVTDNATGLQWQDDEAAKTVTKYWVTSANYHAGNYFDTSGDTAATYCTNLVLGGYSWRLPTITELSSIVDYGRYKPAIDTTFQNVVFRQYWSSTTFANSSSYAWYVRFEEGEHRDDYKGGNRYVRCVRAGE